MIISKLKDGLFSQREERKWGMFKLDLGLWYNQGRGVDGVREDRKRKGGENVIKFPSSSLLLIAFWREGRVQGAVG